jgi:hypothetical protein
MIESPAIPQHVSLYQALGKQNGIYMLIEQAYLNIKADL